MKHLNDAEIKALLEARLGPVHARLRLGIENEYEQRVFMRGPRSFFHPENWYSAHALIRTAFRVSGLYPRARRNTADIRTVRHVVSLPHLPAAFEGFRILHLSDLHIDMHDEVPQQIAERVRATEYDVCVLTGDYRFRTYGDIGPALDGLSRLRANLGSEVYAVLGNHDSVRMVPEMEKLDIRLLMNERVVLTRGDATLHLAGIDDAHFFGVGNIEKALGDCPENDVIILLSHTPEVYRLAAHANVDLLLCGHTHGGQVCLPGGHPIVLDARIPRHLGRGPWRHQRLLGYTSPGAGASLVEVRLNCPPEITIHELRRDAGEAVQ
jgi:predicted MPP superfamily phosphohydrolase